VGDAFLFRFRSASAASVLDRIGRGEFLFIPMMPTTAASIIECGGIVAFDAWRNWGLRSCLGNGVDSCCGPKLATYPSAGNSSRRSARHPTLN